MNYSNDIKIAIIVQGASNYVTEVKNAWKDFKNDLIFSTWKGEESKYNIDDNVIYNDSPIYSGPYNFNYQKKSTYEGLLKAKELGYTHALKIRSDYLPTNAKKFIKLLELDKLNFLMWAYTTYLWLQYPTFNGYLDDHFSFGPINQMIELWDIPINFCFSPETILTWNYISKLSDTIDLNYILPKLNADNDLYYIKFNNITSHLFGHNSINKNFSENELYGRYESVFQMDSNYTKSPIETKKYMNNKYLNFLKYYISLQKVTILNKNNDNLNNIIYPENKIEIVNNINDSTTEYIISSDKLITSATLILEYFKKNDIIYVSPTSSVKSNYINDSLFIDLEEKLIDLDFLEIGTSDVDTLIQECDDNTVGISVEPIKYYIDKLPNKKNVIKVNSAITGDNVPKNTKIKIFYIPFDIIINENLPIYLRGCNSIK